jgi:hypothetical protein
MEKEESAHTNGCEIIDVMCQNVSVRFSENTKLVFFNLLDARYVPM